jgi:ketosteroid isomerase-like protein
VNAQHAVGLIGLHWNARDWTGLQSIFAPDVIGQAPEGWPEPGDMHGWEELQAQLERLREPWAEDSVEGVRQAGDEWRAAGEFIWHCRGHSGVELTESMSVAVTVRDDRITEVGWFREFTEAVAAIKN